VVLVEPQPTPLAGVLGERIGELVARLHRAEGVDVRTGVGVAEVRGTGAVSSVALTDGTEIEADMVVVGIGSRPATDWLDGSGVAQHYPLSYGLCTGVYKVWDPATNTDGGSAFAPFTKLRPNAFSDGLSKTLVFGEFRPDFLRVLSPTFYNQTGSEAIGPNARWSPWAASIFLENIGSVKGMKYVPNQVFAAVNDRTRDTWPLPFSSGHPTGTSMLYGDGAVTFVSENVDITVWRNLSTIAGNEVDTNL
jgi:hypothetical protein